jgi:hypothetical protein
MVVQGLERGRILTSNISIIAALVSSSIISPYLSLVNIARSLAVKVGILVFPGKLGTGRGFIGCGYRLCPPLIDPLAEVGSLIEIPLSCTTCPGPAG